MLLYYSILSTFNILPHILFNAHMTLPAIFILHYRTKLVQTRSHPCKLSCPATSRSSLPPNPRTISPALSRQLTCIYTCCMQLQNQTCSAPQACTTAAWGLLALLRLPFLQSLYICIFTKPDLQCTSSLHHRCLGAACSPAASLSAVPVHLYIY